MAVLVGEKPNADENERIPTDVVIRESFARRARKFDWKMQSVCRKAPVSISRLAGPFKMTDE
jgi:hypothetical protein